MSGREKGAAETEKVRVHTDEGCKVVEMPKGWAEGLWKRALEARAKRATDMPTTEDAVRVMFEAHQRLKELGWHDAIYAPRDGTPFQVIEPGSTGIHNCHVTMDGHQPSFWIDGEWPSRPVLWRASPDSESSSPERGD